MATIEIVDPRAAVVRSNRGSGRGFPDDLDGAVIGVFTDDLWPSYDFVAEEWTRAFEDRGAKVVRWRASPEMRVHVLPYPLVTLPETQIRTIANDQVAALLDACRSRAGRP